jgi:hypothetical protein
MEQGPRLVTFGHRHAPGLEQARFAVSTGWWASRYKGKHRP